MLAVLVFFYVLSYVDRVLLSMVVEPLKADLELSEVQMGLLLGPAFAIFYTLFAFPLGWASDRYPRRWVVYLGVTLWSAATAGCSLAVSFAGLFLGRMSVGIGEAALNPAAYSLIADKFPRSRMTVALAMFAMAPKVGQSIAYTLGGVLLSLAASGMFQPVPILSGMKSWQIVFVLIGVPGLLFALLAFSFTEPPRRGDGAGERQGRLIPYMREHKRLFITMALGFGCIAIMAGALPMWTPTFMVRRYGWSPMAFGPALGTISLIAAAALLLNGTFVDWVYKRGMEDAHLRVYSWLVTAAIPIGATAFFLPNPYWFLALYTLLIAIAMPFMLYLSAAVQLIVPDQLRGRVTGLFMVLLAGIGAGLSPALVALVTEYIFGDPQKIGHSLALVTTFGLSGALLALRASLSPYRNALLSAGVTGTPAQSGRN